MKGVKGVTKETGMFCLNTTHIRQGEDDVELKDGIVVAMSDDLPSTAVITKVENFPLTDEQAMKIKSIHERAVAEVMVPMGW